MDNKAIKELKSDKLKAKSVNNFIELIHICNCLGRKYLETQRHEEAIHEHKEELKVSLQLNCIESEAIARRALGECYSEIGKHDKALEEHKKYLSLAQRLDNKIEIQRAFATIGRTHLLHAQDLSNNQNKCALIEAKKSFLKALQLCDDLSEVKEKELAEMRSRLYLNLGLVFENLGDYNECQKWLYYSIALNKKNGLNEDLFRCQLSLASVYEKNANLEKASQTYDEALKTAKILKNKINICDTHIGKGMVLIRLEKFKQSRSQFKKAYKLKSPIEDDHQKAIRLLKVSSIICDDFRKLSKTDSLEDKISLCDRLGDHFVEMKCFDTAVKYYKKQLNYATQLGKSDSEIAKIYVSIAQTYADDEQFELAANYFNHELNCNHGNDIEECKSLIKIAEMKEYLKREDLNNDIISAYELALEKIGNSDKNLLIDILQRYSSFLESHKINSDKLSELEQRLTTVGRQKTTECERVESDEGDVYDSFDLDDLSDSSDSETDSRPKRVGKAIKKNKMGETELHTACISGNLKHVHKLIESGHPVNVRDYCGWTPLHEAVNHGHIEIVKFLIESGADVNDNEGVECDGITPMHDACSCGHIDIVRLLLKKGANPTILNHFNETALDSLRDWKKRCENLNDKDKKDCELLEHELEEILNKAGFVKPNIPFINNLLRNKRKRSPIRSPESSPEKSDDSFQSSPKNRFRNFPTSNSFVRESDFNLDFDDPRVARDQYSSSISNLRRHKDPNSDLFRSRSSMRTKQNKISALLNEDEVINDEEWLIKDCPDSKKRSCLDAFDAFGAKKSKSTDFRDSSKTHKSKPTNKQTIIESDNEIEVLSSDNKTNFDDESNSTLINKSNNITNTEKIFNNSLRPHSKPILVIVCVRDTENTSFVIPILDRTSICLWLNKEASKRYFAKFGVKPVLSLETIDGALLSDEDCILDVVTGVDLRVNAKIESWLLDPLHDRYKEICQSNKIDPISDIISQLQMTQINGCLKLTDLNIPVEQIKPLFRALQRQNNLREIDISCSNIIFDDMNSCLNCLSFLPSLQVLNLKCTSSSLLTFEELSTKNCSNLIEINLSFNSLGDYFSEAIAKLVKNFSKLNRLDLSACDFTNKLLESNELKDSIKNSNLRSLILDYNKIDSELIEKFRTIVL